MSAFEADWLALREPHDHAARSSDLAETFACALGPEPQVVDLGCGTGSNLRYLSSKLGVGQHWRCIDHDQNLLARAAETAPEVNVQFERCDLARELSSLTLRSGTGTTTSAFLDLTSTAWLDQLVAWCRDAPILAALTFDGRIEWQPPMVEDETIRRHFVAHQRTDKGFGPALGPDAADYLAERLRAKGGRVTLRTSDWHLGSGDRVLLAEMVGGVADAVRAISSGAAVDRWVEARKRQIDTGTLQLTVGHVDLLALPSGPRWTT